MSLESLAPAALPPDAALWFGSTGCGKTQAVIDEIVTLRGFSSFRPIWVLLASSAQVVSFRQRLLDASREGVLFGVEFFTFADLYVRLLDRAGDPQHLISATARTHVLRRVIERLDAEGALELFSPIARTPGFVAWVGRLVSELKQELVQPEHYHEVASQRGPKDRDLARIYGAYQDLLRERHLVDSHGAGWVALEHVQAGDAPMDDVRLLAVDGFDQFNRLHVELVTALARQTERTILTLTQVDEAREARFQRFVETRDRLLGAGSDVWRIEPLPGGHCDRAAPLQHLIDMVFGPAEVTAPAQDALRVIEAPDVGREVSAVLRRVKRQLLDGTPPDTIAILARDLRRYSGALRETAHAYGVPLVVRQGQPLRENPALAALLALIDLTANDFLRRDVLDVLRSPYFAPPGMDATDVADLAQISQEQQVVRGRAEWLAAVRSTVRAPADEDDDVPDDLITDRAGLADVLAAWFDRVTPPAEAPLDELLRWIEDLAGPDPEAEREARAEGEDLPLPAAPRDHMNLLGQVRAASDGEQVARDVLALREFWGVLTGMRAAHALIDGAAGAPIVWEDFRQELELALMHAEVIPPGGTSRVGRVLVTDVLEARGLPHDHVYLLGLAEGVFPAPQSHAELHHEGERIALAEAGVHLRSAAERADDFSLFFQAIGLARQTLTLSRYTVDDAGALVPASPFWKSVLRVVDVPPEARERIPVGAAPPLEDAATPDEAAIATAALLSSDAREVVRALAAHNALLSDPAWANVLRGRLLEARREDARAPFDPYAGLLLQPALVERAAETFGARRVWSASQFNEYGACPFRFFARRMLKLEALEEPEEGYDVRQLGSIYHAILERTYGAVRDEGLVIVPEHLPRALELLEDTAAEVFATAPDEHGFRPSATWQHEQAMLLRRLRWLVEQDFSADVGRTLQAFTGGAPRTPYALEARFGMDGLPPVAIDGPAGPLRVRGVIDRLDRAGDAIVVIDYKSGSSAFNDDDLISGRNVQMLVYLLAAEQLLAAHGERLQVAGGLFWHIANRKTSGAVAVGAEALDAARDRLHLHVEAARAGHFVVRPSKPLAGGRCAFFNQCDYSAMCRLTRSGQRKTIEGDGA